MVSTHNSPKHKFWVWQACGGARLANSSPPMLALSVSEKTYVSKDLCLLPASFHMLTNMRSNKGAVRKASASLTVLAQDQRNVFKSKGQLAFEREPDQMGKLIINNYCCELCLARHFRRKMRCVGSISQPMSTELCENQYLPAIFCRNGYNDDNDFQQIYLRAEYLHRINS